MATMAAAVASLFAHAQPNAYILLGKRGKKGGVYPTQAIKVSDIAAKLANFKPAKSADLYVTHSTYKGGFTTENLPQYCNESRILTACNIVIDVDAHGTGNRGKGKAAKAAFEKNRRSVLSAFAQDVDAAIRRKELPQYTARISTGRGMQFWYSIEPIAPALIFLFRKAASVMATAYSSLIAAEDEGKCGLYTLFGLSVDAAASQRPSGFYRLPCSYNTKGDGKKGTAKVTAAEPMSIDEMLDALHVDRTPKKRQTIAGSKPSYMPTYKRRMALLNWIISDGEELDGRRDTLCFLRYCTAKCLLGGEMAAQDLKDFNKRMPHPMRATEISSIIRSVDRKGVYFFRNETWYNLAGITEVEAAMAIPVQKQKRAAAQERKAKRDAQIIEMAHQGATWREITGNLGISMDTATTIITKAKIDTRAERKARQKKQISSLLAAGHTRNEVMAALKISRPTLQRRLKEMREAGDA